MTKTLYHEAYDALTEAFPDSVVFLLVTSVTDPADPVHYIGNISTIPAIMFFERLIEDLRGTLRADA